MPRTPPASLPLLGLARLASDGANSGGTGEDRFFGWSDPGGILEIWIHDPGSPGVGIEVDHLQYGRATALPAVGPLAVGLAAVSLLALGAWRIRRHGGA